MNDFQDELTDEMREKIINEEYKIWKKNSPFLYDLILTHALSWPSLTVQWYPQKEIQQDSSIQSLLIGTHTTEDEDNFLMIADVVLPSEDSLIDPRKYDNQTSDFGGFGSPSSRVRIRQKIAHDGEVNRARYMPQNTSIVATQTTSTDVYIFDTSKLPEFTSTCTPLLKLKGQTKEGYGLSWNQNIQGHLLSCSDDGKICLWDINSEAKNGSIVPLATFESEGLAIEDVAWHVHHETYFGSVGDDFKVLIWDTRTSEKPTQEILGHEAEVNCISFNPFNEFLFATGSNDKSVKLWDMRKPSEAVHTFLSHADQIFQVQWSPFNETILGSCGQDRRLLIWDLSRIGKELSSEELIDGPPELLFIHGGHTSKISDFSFNLNDPWIIASVSEDNILQIWQMSENIYQDSDSLMQEEPAE